MPFETERDAGRPGIPDEPISQEAARAMLAALRLAERALTEYAPPAFDPALGNVRAAIALAERGA